MPPATSCTPSLRSGTQMHILAASTTAKSRGFRSARCLRSMSTTEAKASARPPTSCMWLSPSPPPLLQARRKSAPVSLPALSTSPTGCACGRRRSGRYSASLARLSEALRGVVDHVGDRVVLRVLVGSQLRRVDAQAEAGQLTQDAVDASAGQRGLPFTRDPVSNVG